MSDIFLRAHVQRRHAEDTEAGEHWDGFPALSYDFSFLLCSCEYL